MFLLMVVGKGNWNLSRRTPHPALRATFPSRGRLLEHAATVALAFPLRGRWHDEVVTDEVVLPRKFQFKLPTLERSEKYRGRRENTQKIA